MAQSQHGSATRRRWLHVCSRRWLSDPTCSVALVLMSSRCPACDSLGPSPCVPCAESIRAPGAIPAPAGVDQVVAAMSYEGVARDIIVALKYRNARCVVPWLASCIAGRARSLGVAAQCDVVTWVPATPSTRRRRGFDQGELLAMGVGRQLELPTQAMLRRRSDNRQTGLERAQRLAGPTVSARPRIRVVQRSVLVIDDVLTTGGSMQACASELRANGACKVLGAVAAHTPPGSRLAQRSLDHEPHSGERSTTFG